MNAAEQKIKSAVDEITRKTKSGDVVSISEIAESIPWTKEDEKELYRKLVISAVQRLAAKGLPADISDEELAAEVSRQIEVDMLAFDLEEHAEGDLYRRL